MEDEEAEAMRRADDVDEVGLDLPPLCPRCQESGFFWTDDSNSCPMCDRGGRSGSWLVCAACAAEAAVCVNDAAPLDGSSPEPVPWLAEVAAAARRQRYEAQFGKPGE